MQTKEFPARAKNSLATIKSLDQVSSGSAKGKMIS